MKFVDFGSVHINLDRVLYITASFTRGDPDPLLVKFVFSDTLSVSVRVADTDAMNKTLGAAIGYKLDVAECG